MERGITGAAILDPAVDATCGYSARPGVSSGGGIDRVGLKMLARCRRGRSCRAGDFGGKHGAVRLPLDDGIRNRSGACHIDQHISHVQDGLLLVSCALPLCRVEGVLAAPSPTRVRAKFAL